MTALAGFQDRIEEMLQDTGNAIWSTDVIDEGIKQALDQYNLVNPLTMETARLPPLTTQILLMPLLMAVW